MRFLRLGTRVVAQVGTHRNVGENFTLRFTASNQAYPANLVNDPRTILLMMPIFT